jgi:hypothetical protein
MTDARRNAVPAEDVRPLTKEQRIVNDVLKLIGEATTIENDVERRIDRNDIDAALYRMREARLATQRMHARQSKPAMRAIQQFIAALRKANRAKGGVPEDIRLLLGLEHMLYHLEAYANAHRKPKPDAIEKRLAAEEAAKPAMFFPRF